MLSSLGDDLGSLGRRGSQCVSANQNQGFLSTYSGLHLTELGIKLEMQQLPLPSDTVSHIISDNFTGFAKKIDLKKKLGNYSHREITMCSNNLQKFLPSQRTQSEVEAHSLHNARLWTHMTGI